MGGRVFNGVFTSSPVGTAQCLEANWHPTKTLESFRPQQSLLCYVGKLRPDVTLCLLEFPPFGDSGLSTWRPQLVRRRRQKCFSVLKISLMYDNLRRLTPLCILMAPTLGATARIWTLTLPPVDHTHTHMHSQEPLFRGCLQKVAGRLVKIALCSTVEVPQSPPLPCLNLPSRHSVPRLGSRSICLHISSWAGGGRGRGVRGVLLLRRFLTLANVEEIGSCWDSIFMCSAPAYCTSRVDKSNQWFATWWESSGVALGLVRGFSSNNCHGTRLVLRGGGKFAERKICGGCGGWGGEWEWGEEKNSQEMIERWGHGSAPLSCSKKVYWNSCSDPCHLFSCSLVPGANLSASTVCSTWQKGSRPQQNLQQPGAFGILSASSTWKLTICSVCMDFLHHGQDRFQALHCKPVTSLCVCMHVLFAGGLG